MENQVEWTRVFVSWVPFIVIVIAMFVCMRLYRPRAASGATMIELYEQQVAETRRTNAMLERIARALETQSPPT